MVCSNLPSSGPKLCSNALTSVRFDHQFFLKRQHQQAWNLLWNFSSWSSVCESELLTMEHLHKKDQTCLLGWKDLTVSVQMPFDCLWASKGEGGKKDFEALKWLTLYQLKVMFCSHLQSEATLSFLGHSYSYLVYHFLFCVFTTELTFYTM